MGCRRVLYESQTDTPEPAWRRNNRCLIRGVRLSTAVVLIMLPAMVGFVAWTRTGSAKWVFEIETVMILASLGGCVALAFTTNRAHRCGRPLNVVDVIRMICWVIVGWGLLSACASNPVAGLMLVGGLLVIGVLSLVFRPPQPPPAGTCLECGYDLRGLTEPRCPECGTPFRSSEVGRIDQR